MKREIRLGNILVDYDTVENIVRQADRLEKLASVRAPTPTDTMSRLIMRAAANTSGANPAPPTPGSKEVRTAGEVLKTLGMTGLAGLTLATGAGLGMEAVDGTRNAIRSLSREDRYQAMLKEAEDDDEMLATLKSKKGRRFFNMLDRLAPTITDEPTLAGPEVNTLVNSAATSGALMIERAVNVDNKVRESKRPLQKGKVDLRVPSLT